MKNKLIATMLIGASLFSLSSPINYSRVENYQYTDDVASPMPIDSFFPQQIINTSNNEYILAQSVLGIVYYQVYSSDGTLTTPTTRINDNVIEGSDYWYLEELSNGNILLMQNLLIDNSNVFTIYDSDFNVVSQASYTSTNADAFTFYNAVDNGETIYMGGREEILVVDINQLNNTSSYNVVQTDSDTDSYWDEEINWEEITINSDGSATLAGVSLRDNSSWLVTVDENGNVLHRKQHTSNVNYILGDVLTLENGNVWVYETYNDSSNPTIFVYDQNLNLIDTIYLSGTMGYSQMTLLNDGNVMLADEDSNRILILDDEGNELFEMTSPDGNPIQDFYVNEDGNIVWTSLSNFGIMSGFSTIYSQDSITDIEFIEYNSNNDTLEYEITTNTGTDQIYISSSFDNGQTWTNATTTNISNNTYSVIVDASGLEENNIYNLSFTINGTLQTMTETVDTNVIDVTPPPTGSDGNDSSSNLGLILGITFGVIGAIALIGIGYWFYLKRKAK